MTEEVQMALDEAKASNEKAIQHLISELEKIRAGKATPSLLDSVVVEYYGALTPLSQLANVSTMDARTLTVQPWEKGLLEEIAKGITHANLGLNPQNNGEMIIINVPALTEERRLELVKKAKAEGEHAKVSIRNNRKESNDLIKSLKSDGLSEDQVKDAEAKIQTITDQYTKRVDEVVVVKEKDILTV
ncbi:MAG: ribosome recycling factor [Crocinitomicaceae bacterium]|nr:ribosome recycling factor [Crocinitomicaceae bacterium]